MNERKESIGKGRRGEEGKGKEEDKRTEERKRRKGREERMIYGLGGERGRLGRERKRE